MTLADQSADIPQGKYELLGKSGKGGMGEVYKARHRLLGELRAIKVMRDLSSPDPRLQKRFLLEAQMAAGLKHPNLAQIYDVAFSSNGTPHIVMEWVEGVDVARLLEQRGPPPLSDVLEIARQSLSALGYLHGEGVVHRDVSTANLMVTRQPNGELGVKLIDLGIAKSLKEDHQLTRKGVFAGKFKYAAPETLDPKTMPAKPDPRSDLYSFGVVLYEVLTGVGPITGETASDLIAAHLLKPPVPFAESDPDDRVPESLREVVLKSLEKAPEERFQTAAALAEALEAAWASTAPSEEDSRSAATVDLPAPAAGDLAGDSLERRQGELDQTFASGARDLEPGSVETTWVGGAGQGPGRLRRRASALTTAAAELFRRYPRRVSIGAAAAAVLAVVGIAGLLSGEEAQPASGEAAEITSPPITPAAEPTAPDPDEEAAGAIDEVATPAAPPAENRSARPEPLALISDSPLLSTVILEEIGSDLPVVIRGSLREAIASLRPGGRGAALRLSATAQAIAVEAYDTQLPTCEAVATAEILTLPAGRPVVSRTRAGVSPRCAGALQQVGQALARELVPRLREVLAR